jgi:RNA polymerase sigma-70 factor (ECF subfamily)
MTDQGDDDLVARFRQGDQQAATELFHRYVSRLVALVRPRLSNKLRGRFDAEDVVQSAWRSFFRRVQADQIEVEGDLWQLLATITLYKAIDRCRQHGTAGRDIAREQCSLSPKSLPDLVEKALAREPSPQEAELAFFEVLEHCQRDLPQRYRDLIALRLQGRAVAEITATMGCSRRTYERAWKDFETQVGKYFNAEDANLRGRSP